MTDDAISILACVPVAAMPDFPIYAPYSKYTIGECHHCKCDVWVGERGKAIIEAGGAIPVCPYCAVRIYGLSGSEPMQQLTDPNT